MIYKLLLGRTKHARYLLSPFVFTLVCGRKRPWPLLCRARCFCAPNKKGVLCRFSNLCLYFIL